MATVIPMKKSVPVKKSGAPVAKKPGFLPTGAPPKPLTAAEKKARLAAAAERAALVTHAAPEDFKSLTFSLKFRTLHDGTIDPKVKCDAIKGRWDNPDARRVDMMLYDPITVIGIVSRLSAVTYASNVARRLPPDAAFGIVGRAGANKDGNIIFGLRYAAQAAKKGNKTVWVPFEDKADPIYRKLRRATRLLRGAFIEAAPIPSVSEVKSLIKAATQEESVD